MPEAAQTVRLIEVAVDNVPAAILAMVLLAGPTAVYIVWLFVGPQRTTPTIEHQAVMPVPIEADYWRCPECRSLTSLDFDTCYHCGLRIDEDDYEEDEGAWADETPSPVPTRFGQSTFAQPTPDPELGVGPVARLSGTAARRPTRILEPTRAATAGSAREAPSGTSS